MAGDELLGCSRLVALLSQNEPAIENVRGAVIEAYNREHATDLDPREAPDPAAGTAIGRWLREVAATRSDEYLSQLWRLQEFVSDGLEAKFRRVQQSPCAVCGVRRDFPGRHFTLRVRPRSYQYESSPTKTAFRLAVAAALKEREMQTLGSASICMRLVYAIAPGRTAIDIDNITKLTLDALKGQLFDDDRQVVHLDLVKLPCIGAEFISVNLWPTRLDDHRLDTFRADFELIWDRPPIDIDAFLPPAPAT